MQIYLVLPSQGVYNNFPKIAFLTPFRGRVVISVNAATLKYCGMKMRLFFTRNAAFSTKKRPLWPIIDYFSQKCVFFSRKCVFFNQKCGFFQPSRKMRLQQIRAKITEITTLPRGPKTPNFGRKSVPSDYSE